MTNVNVLSTNNGAEMTVRVSNESEELMQALAAHLDQEFEGHDDFIILDAGTREDYLIESQEHMLWAFDTNFIGQYIKDDIQNEMNMSEFREFKESLHDIQGRLCESANSLIKGITNWESMIANAVRIDGYGHFLNGYDGNEYEFEYAGETYYIYFNN